MKREIGTVVHVVEKGGYWFILGKHGQYFCHISNWLEPNLPKVGDRVSFELGPSKFGRPDQAVKVLPELGAGAQELAHPSSETTTLPDGTTVTRAVL